MFFKTVRRTKELGLTLWDPPLIRALISLFPTELETPPWHASRLLLGWAQHRHPGSCCSGALTAPALPLAHPHCHFWALTSSDEDYSYKICENQSTRIMSLPAESRGVFKVDLKSLIFLNSGCNKKTNKNFGKQLLQLFMSGSKLASLDFFERNLLKKKSNYL